MQFGEVPCLPAEERPPGPHLQQSILLGCVSAPDMRMSRRALRFNFPTAETVRRLCQEGQGQLTEAVEALGILVQAYCRVSVSLMYTVLKQCVVRGDLAMGRRVHAFTLDSGFQSDTFLCNHIIRMYTSHGRLQEAMDVFTVVGQRDAFMWSSIISAHVKHGRAVQAIELYREMRRSNVKPDGHVFVAALQACAKGADVKAGLQVHADVFSSGVEPDLFVSNCLVDMYAKCGNLEHGQGVFDRLARKDVVTWNAMIAGYSQQGLGQEALRLYGDMQEEGISVPDSVTFVSLLQACSSEGVLALEKGKELHAKIEKQGLKVDIFVGCSLVNMYSKCGSLEDARRVFNSLGRKDVITWTALITGYSQQGLNQEAIHLYSVMQAECITTPNPATFVCLLQACASMGALALEKGKQLHAQIEAALGLQADMMVGGSLVNMYVRCGSLQDAHEVFDRLDEKTAVGWTALIAGYTHQGLGQEALDLYSSMQDVGIAPPNPTTVGCLLQACASVGGPALAKGKQLHARIVERGLQVDTFLGSSLVKMYAKCGRIEDAQCVFDGLTQKAVVTWNAMIAAYSQQGMGQEALDVYSSMSEEGIFAPDSATFVSLLQACACVGNMALQMGKQLHAQIGEQGLDADAVVSCSLVNMYAKCGSLEDAQDVFDRIARKNAVTWTALISGYSQQDMGHKALHLYSAMRDEGIAPPNSMTFVCLLQACAAVGTPALRDGKQLHAQVREQGLEADVFVGCSLVNMYAKCGSLEDAQGVFDKLGEKDVVTWTALIAGYSQQGMAQEALNLYSVMRNEGITLPNAVTFLCLLQACANVAALYPGRHLHAEIEEKGLQADVLVAKSLINMYAKSGSMVDAQQLFDALPERDVVAWNVLIAGYTCQGDYEAVFHLVHRMQVDGTEPNSITFLSVLTVCSYAGLVDEGQEYFNAMTTDYSITPATEHYTCMVDILGRAGQLDTALAFARAMPVLAPAAVWRTLLSACGTWSNLEVGRCAFHEAVKLDEQDAPAYVLMANIYMAVHMWEEGMKMQTRRVQIGARKQPGQSWWTDRKGLVHSFLAGDRKYT